MGTWKFDYELGCLRGPAPDLVPAVYTRRVWEVYIRNTVPEPPAVVDVKAGIKINMTNKGGGDDPSMADIEFRKIDPHGQGVWTNQTDYMQLFRNGVVRGEYVFKVESVGGSTTGLSKENAAGVRGNMAMNTWLDLYAPLGTSYDDAGGWWMYLSIRGGGSTTSYYMCLDITFANNDGFDNPVPGTEVLLRVLCTASTQYYGTYPYYVPYPRYVQVEEPVGQYPNAICNWGGPPVVTFLRDDYDYIYHNVYWYWTTGGGSNFEWNWWKYALGEAQHAYGFDGGDQATFYKKWTSLDRIYRDTLMIKFEHVSGDNVLELDYGGIAMGEWWSPATANAAQILDAQGVPGILSGVYDITMAQNKYQNTAYPYTFDPVPGSEQRRRYKWVTQYTTDPYEPLPDLSPPYDPDYEVHNPTPFEITVRTTTPNETVSLPLAADDVDLAGWLGVCATVSWGDGSSNALVEVGHASASHTYALAGDHEISIVGRIEGWQYDLLPTSEALKLIEVRAWGETEIRSFYHGFYGCANMTVTATDAPDLSRCANMAGMFYGCTALTGDFSNWQPTNCFRFEQMFYNCVNFTSDLSAWPVAENIHLIPGIFTNMSEMFYGATLFNSDVSGWNMFDVEEMTDMFTGSGLTTENYDLLLNAWSQIKFLSFWRTLNVDVPYTITASQAARDYLTGTVYWDIFDGGGI